MHIYYVIQKGRQNYRQTSYTKIYSIDSAASRKSASP